MMSPEEARVYNWAMAILLALAVILIMLCMYAGYRWGHENGYKEGYADGRRAARSKTDRRQVRRMS